MRSHNVLLPLLRYLLLVYRLALISIIVDKQYLSVSVFLKHTRCSPANASLVGCFAGRRELSYRAGRVTLPLLLTRSAVPKATTEEARPFAPCPQVVSRVLINIKKIMHTIASFFTFSFSDRLRSLPDRACLLARFSPLKITEMMRSFFLYNQ